MQEILVELSGVNTSLDIGLEHWRRYFSILDPATVYPALLEFVKDNTEEQFLMDVKALKELIEEI